MNKKGLIRGLIATIVLLFAFAIIALFSSTLWDSFNTQFQSLDNDTASPDVKERVNGLGIYMDFGDTLFVFLFIALLISYIISASVSNTESPIFLLIFLGSLIIVTLIAMIFSNMWKFMINNPSITSLDDYKFTDFILTYFPAITFFTGVVGGVIFYTRRGRDEGAGGGGEF